MDPEEDLDSTEDLDEEDGEETPADSGSDNSAPPADGAPDDKSSTRINDLMSKWQSEQAKANRLQKELDELMAGKGSPAKGDAGSGAGADEFVQFARETTRTTLFESDPRLANYGLTADDIAGDTVAEMKASLSERVKWITQIESKARERVLEEHGLTPEVSTGSLRDTGKTFSTMSEKEFAEFLKERDSAPRL